MKRIYISHARSYPFREQLYKPILESNLREKFDIILPHEPEGEINSSKDTIATAAIVIAEVSYPSTGQGIELGWADILGKPIFGLYREGAQVSESVKLIIPRLFSYQDEKQLIETIHNIALDRF